MKRTEAGWRKPAEPAPADSAPAPALSGIEHLDFPTPDVSTDEKAKKRILCSIRRSHPFDEALEDCGRPAVYLVSYEMPCGHAKDCYLCQGCWNMVERQPPERVNMLCSACKIRWPFKPTIRKWEKIA